MNQKTTVKSDICFGLQSNCSDGLHIFMVDIDIDNLPNPITQNNIGLIVKTAFDMQETYQLSDIYISKTKNGFHLLSLDKLELDFIVSILANYDIVDLKYIALAMNWYRGFFVNRFGYDKQYLTFVESKYNCYEKSYPHYVFLKEIMKYPIKNYDNFDENNEVTFIAYRSSKHGWLQCNNMKDLNVLNNNK